LRQKEGIFCIQYRLLRCNYNNDTFDPVFSDIPVVVKLNDLLY